MASCPTWTRTSSSSTAGRRVSGKQNSNTLCKALGPHGYVCRLGHHHCSCCTGAAGWPRSRTYLSCTCSPFKLGVQSMPHVNGHAEAEFASTRKRLRQLCFATSRAYTCSIGTSRLRMEYLCSHGSNAGQGSCSITRHLRRGTQIPPPVLHLLADQSQQVRQSRHWCHTKVPLG